MPGQKHKLTIYDYFEMYLNNKIQYDRQYHINNMTKYGFTQIDHFLIKKIFIYLDQVIFDGKLTDYMKENDIIFQCKVSRSMTSTAGFFFVNKIKKNNIEKYIIGFKISRFFFQNIIDKKIINIDLGVIDSVNKKSLSTNPIEPLLVTMEHEIIHMLMYFTKDRNDSETVKSGHTPMFKNLVFNIFGHYKITHGFTIGDTTINDAIKKTIEIGSYVKNVKTNQYGYVVGMKNKNAIICEIESGKTKYSSSFYKDLEIIEKLDKIDVKDLLSRLKPHIKIKANQTIYEIIQINDKSIKAITPDKRIWKIPKIRILDIVFM